MNFGDKMKREDIKTLLVLAIGLLLIIVAVKFFIKLLPLIIVLLFCLLVYDSYKRMEKKPTNKKKNKDNIKEAEIVKEKDID